MRTKSNKKIDGLTINQLSEALSRNLLGQMAGVTHGGKRDLYQECGYPRSLSFKDFENRYKRQGVAKRLVTAFPNGTWTSGIRIIENKEKDQTVFEEKSGALIKRLKLWSVLKRADRVAGIGQYAVVVLGFNDRNSSKPNLPVKSATDLVFVKPYRQSAVSITKWVDDTGDPRFGLPEIYSIDTSSQHDIASTSKMKLGTIQVHWSRVLHIAEDTDDSEIYGTPRLQAVYNRLQDLETITGGSAEMFWKGGFQGISFEMDKDAMLDTDAKNEMDTHMQEYFHGLRRYLRLQGVEAKQLMPTVANPSSHVEVQFMLLSAASEIPVRILTGSERGQLASGQDERNWNRALSRRQMNFAEPNVIRPLFDRLMQLGVLPEVEEYHVVWPLLDTETRKDKAEAAKYEAEALGIYIEKGVDMVLSPFQFMTKVIGWDEDQAEAALDEVNLELINEAKELEEIDAGASTSADDKVIPLKPVAKKKASKKKTKKEAK